MNHSRILPICSMAATAVLAGALLAPAASAEPPGREGREGHEGRETHPAPHNAKPAPAPRYVSPHWQLDARFHHDRYYPARGYVVNTLPSGHMVIEHPTGRYYFHAGVWFRPRGATWIVVAPPFGIVIPLLPPGYSTVYWRGIPYYYADDVYYERADSGYRVVEAPPANEVTLEESATLVAAPPVTVSVPAAASVIAPVPSYVKPSGPADGLFVYPKNGQTESQTTFDRIECVKWAIGQTGFDPARPSGDAGTRDNFHRAAIACLEGRGYSVK